MANQKNSHILKEAAPLKMGQKRKHPSIADAEIKKHIAEEETENMEFEGENSDSHSEESVKSCDINKKKRTKSVKIPPIVITTQIKNPDAYIKNIRSVLQMPNLKLQLGRDRLTIFLENQEDHTAAVKKLKTAGIEHFAHPLDKVKQKHLVLKGLHNISTDEIQQDL